MSRYLVWGAGGHGKVVADAARATGLDIAGFIDIPLERVGTVVEPGGAKMTHTQADFLATVAAGALPEGITAVILAIGSNIQRQRCRMHLPEQFMKTVIHPSAIVSKSAHIGAGSVILAGAIVNASARLGAGVIVNTAAVVEHDCDIGDDSHIAPRSVLAGAVTVGQRVLVGAGAVIIPNINIGTEAIIGAGAVVIRDVSDGLTVVGNPAKKSHQIIHD